MQPFPTLTPEALKVLEIIVSNIAIDGSTLMKRLEATAPDEVAKPVRELQKRDLIEVGGTMSAEGLPFARFGIRPSAKEYLNSLLKHMA